MHNKIAKFIAELSSQDLPPNAFNQYADETRRNNLKLYFEQMMDIEPKVLLVGEAPGYKGCRLTGVPFTSEYIILNGIKQLDLFGEEKGYKKAEKSESMQKEATATIVWEAVKDLSFIPLMWNAYPFHPHRIGNPHSNRLPTKEELEIGASFLRKLLDIFKIETVVAVGNTAKRTLDNLNIISTKVRHPSNGGKIKFKEGLREV